MRATGTLRAYAELARVSNLPTCVSNSLVGCALGAGGRVFPWATVPLVAGAVCLFYVAGMALNDVFDRGIDRVERPERPIPSGRVSATQAWGFAGAAMVAGLGLLSLSSVSALYFGLLLIGFIVLYDAFHKGHPSSVVLMGACRATVYFTAAAAVAWPFAWKRTLFAAGALGLYTVLITVVARSENLGTLDTRKWLALLLPAMILAVALVIPPPNWTAAGSAALLLLLWQGRAARAVLKHPPDTRAAIHNWISGMCLIDLFFLTLLDQQLAALVAFVCFALTVFSHRHVPGT